MVFSPPMARARPIDTLLMSQSRGSSGDQPESEVTDERGTQVVQKDKETTEFESVLDIV